MTNARVADALAGAVEPDRELVDRVSSLYRQAPASGWGSVVVALCLVAVMWRWVAPATLLGWLALTLPIIAIRIPLIRGFRAHRLSAASAVIWARRYTLMVSAIGVSWGLAAFLMLRPGDPLAVACFLMVLALISAGNIASQSYYLPAVHTFLCLALVPTALRLALFGEAHYAAIAVTVVLFFSFLVAYAHVQSKQIGEAIRLKHENLNLIEALRSEKEHAEMLRALAEQANLAKSQFLAAASHDLRQPLHALGLFSASLHEMAMEPEKRMVVDNIFASIDALESLFSELLDLSRLDAGHIQPRLRHMPLGAIIDRLRVRHAPLAEVKGLTLSMGSSAAIVYSDPVLLERVLGNLVANAIQYTQRGTVSLHTSATESDVMVEVRDTGAGIAEEYRDRIFEEFFQIGNMERDRRKGLGLGLAIVRRISGMLGHPLSLQSQVGSGSCFTLRVPRGDPAAIESEPDVPAATGDLLTGKTILVVDDEASVLQGMRELLVRWGCEVLAAPEPGPAIQAARSHPPDLIVADLRLRFGSSGMDAIEAVRDALGRTVPALIITGDTSVDALRQARIHGYPVLHKPVRPVKLRAALSQLLAGHGTPTSRAAADVGARTVD